jgi:hypothetical protein
VGGLAVRKVPAIANIRAAEDVATIVGLRAYTAESNILPEQTLGRGLRRMYFGRPVNPG